MVTSLTFFFSGLKKSLFYHFSKSALKNLLDGFGDQTYNCQGKFLVMGQNIGGLVNHPSKYTGEIFWAYLVKG